MNELHLFAGAGGGILAGQLLGRRCVCAVESEPYAQAVLVARQNDGTFPPFPIWDDVRTFDGRPWRSIVDVVAGGFPCQDISAAGGGEGLAGERSGLWSEMARVIREVQPGRVEVENSPMLTSRGLGRVLGDLAEMGFDAEWGVLSAADVDAPHLRERIWISGYLADPMRDGRGKSSGFPSDRRAHEAQQTWLGGGGEDVADTLRQRQQRFIPWSLDAEDRKEQSERSDRSRSHGLGRWPAEPAVGRVVDGMAHRAHRIRALGNGQVSRVAATAWRLLSEQS